MQTSGTAQTRARALLIAASLASAAAAQVILAALPGHLRLPRALEDALRPMWPDAGAAALGLAVFVVAAALAARASRSCVAADAWQAFSLELRGARATRRAVLAPAAVGGCVLAWVLVRAWTGHEGLGLAGAFLVALLAFFVSLTALEGFPVRRVPGRRPITAAGLVEAAYVIGAVAVFWVAATHDLGSWYYSVLGDEYAFYDAAAAFARGEGIGSLFSQRGAYGIIPVLSAFLQGQSMRLFGTDAVGWKTATLVPLAAALPLFYLLARAMYGRLTAALALGFLATSHYLLAYAHTGYPNLEPLLPSIAAMLLLVHGLDRGSRLLLAGAGALAGAGWYTYYTSRVAIVIIAVAIPLVARRAAWRRGLGWVGAGFLLAVSPLVATSKWEVVSRMLQQAGNGPTAEYARNHALLPLWNLGRSILAFNYNRHNGPYLLGSLAEPVTAALLLAGVGWLLGSWRDGRSRLLLAWLALGVAAVGVLSKYDYVSVSRLNFLLPAVALCAAVAAREGVRALGDAAGGRTAPALAAASLLGVSAFLNLDRFFVQAPAQVGSTPEAVVFRVALDPRCQGAERPPLVVDAGIGGALPPAFKARGVRRPPEWALYGAGREWLETADSRCVVFLAPQNPEAIELAAALTRRWPGLRLVAERDLSGQVGIFVTYPPRVRGAGVR